ncbi:Endo-1,4-beta-xylanase A [Fervidicola ferrireducens]|uniref:Endo-1,4-beta-xylanase A n=1 Tax=Fervidicola ferrireducens TaxID=520764 RepID=A0A140LCS8_9FIRM|nr:S8 family serine peptidase [Fervidicola ferrireducens]KXG78353.1 Endo-1,4-beta-xylanase A [Fervidicola ferrireducens]
MEKLKKIIPLVIFFMVFSIIFSFSSKAEAADFKGGKDFRDLVLPKRPAGGLDLQLKSAIRAHEQLQREYEILSPDKIRLVIMNDGRDITSELFKAGAKVVKRIASDLYSITIPKAKAENLLSIKGIKKISLDKIYQLDPREMKGFDEIKAKIDEIRPNLETTLDDTNVLEFREKYGADGSGVVIAILDTGVEPDHEMLRYTSSGDIKIIDWKDFTTEGDIITDTPVTVSQMVYDAVYSSVYKAAFEWDDITFTLPENYFEKTVYVGSFVEEILPNEVLFGYTPDPEETGFDFNLDGDKEDEYYAVVVDEDGDGKYDAAMIDTDTDHDFSDEFLLRPYKEGVDEGERIFASFPAAADDETRKVNFVLTQIYYNEEGSVEKINIGFDGNSHGTHVAGIAAGNGSLVGVAPGAKIMALKVLGSNVGGAMSHIIEAMIYAAENGADVVNMSLGSAPDINDGTGLEAIVADILSEIYGTAFAISAGNNGPGINTIGTPGDSTWAITSGAYIESDTWAEYGYDVPGKGLWYFSSRGPREDGFLKPTIVSPGSAISSVPIWMYGETYAYDLYQGTSMSSPHTAGIIALLTQKAREDGVTNYENDRIHPLFLAEALQKTARPIGEKYLPVDVGGGLVDVVKAYEYVVENHDKEIIRLHAFVDYSEKLPYATGIYIRNKEIPEKIGISLYRENTSETLNLKIDAPDWIRPSTNELTFPQGEQEAYFEVSLDTGLINSAERLLSDFITISEESRGELLKIPVTIVVPQKFSADNNYEIKLSGELEAAEYDRYFIKVPAGAKELNLRLLAPENNGRFRAIFHDPDGLEYDYYIGYCGLGSETNELYYSIPDPKPGVWEINIYASPSQRNLQASNNMEPGPAPYEAIATLKGLVFEPDKVDITAPASTLQEKNLKIVNLMGEELSVKLEGSGFVDLNTPGETKYLEFDVENTDPDDEIYSEDYVEFFTIKEDNANFLFEASIKSLTNPEEDDYDLYLYKEGPDGYYYQYAYSADGDADEEIKVENLPAGNYAIQIVNFATPSGKATIEYTKRILNESDAVPGIGIAADPAEMAINYKSVSDVVMKIPVPTGESDYVAILKASADGELLNTVSVRVKSLPQDADANVNISLNLDRGKYGPNDIVKISGRITDASGNGMAQKAAVISIKDSRGRIIFIEEVISDEQGAFKLDWPVPKEIGMGSYTASAESYGKVASKTFVIDTLPPGEVTNVSIEARIKSIILSWQEPYNSDFAKVRIYVDGVLNKEVPKGTNNALIDNLQKGTDYELKLTAVDDVGNESAGVYIDVRTLNKILKAEGIKGKYSAKDKILITGTVLSGDDESPLAGEELAIFIKHDGTVVYEGKVTTDTEGLFNAKIPVGADWPEGRYTVEILLQDEMLSFVFELDLTPPSEVTNLSKVEKEGAAEIFWKDPNDLDFVKVKVYVDGVLYGEVQKGVMKASLEGLTEGKQYTVKVTTVDDVDNESQGNEIKVTPKKSERSETGSGGGGSAASPETTIETSAGKAVVGENEIRLMVDAKKLIIPAEEKGQAVVDLSRYDKKVVIVEFGSDIVDKLARSESTLLMKTASISMEIDKDAARDIKNAASGKEKVTVEFKKVDNVPATTGKICSDVMDVAIKAVSGKNETLIEKLANPVTLHIYYDPAKIGSIDPRKIAVYHYDEKTGTWEYLGGKVDAKAKSISAKAKNFSLYALIAHDRTFEDIKAHWAKTEIEVLASRGIVKGVDDRNFLPEKNITRAEFAALLVRALGLEPENVGQAFSDVKPGDWFKPYVETAAKYGIVKGFGDKFRPNDPVSRQEMAVMVARVLRAKGALPKDGIMPTVEKFRDKDQIADWAKQDINEALAGGIIKGVTSDTFAPAANSTRAQAAVIILRLLEALGEI